MGADSPEKPCCCAKRKALAIADEAGQESFRTSDPPNLTLGEQDKNCCEPAFRRSAGKQLGKT